MRYHASQELTVKLDNNTYSKEETFLFKMPLTLPYQINPHGYERVDGKFEHNGEYFRLVKQKLENDTLFIVCIRDHKEKQLTKVMKDFAKLSTDVPISKQGQSLLAKLIKDYESNATPGTVLMNGWSLSIPVKVYLGSLLEIELAVPSPPPDNLFS